MNGTSKPAPATARVGGALLVVACVGVAQLWRDHLAQVLAGELLGREALHLRVRALTFRKRPVESTSAMPRLR